MCENVKALFGLRELESKRQGDNPIFGRDERREKFIS